MTRIGGTYRIGYTGSRTGLPTPMHPKRMRPLNACAGLEASCVTNEPVEEVVFESHGGVDPRSRRRGFVVSEVREERLEEQRATTQTTDPRGDLFWTRFSTPFMAQVIGQAEEA